LNKSITRNSAARNAAIILVLVLAAFFIVANVFAFGKDDLLTIRLNTVLNPLVLLIVTVLTLLLLHQVYSIARSRPLWIGLILGFACWTTAEVLWTISFLKGLEPPYPSWADLFWCLGYLPMYLAIGLRARSITGKPGPWSILFLSLVSLTIIGFTVWGILLPILRTYDPSTALESALNLIYPLADTVLIVLALIILFSVRRGTFTAAWTWISIGFVILSFADLFFTYTSGQDTYYPGGAVTFTSVFLVDVPYTISYMLILLGLILLLQMKQAPVLPPKPQGRE
jgi:hypothetical protein